LAVPDASAPSGPAKPPGRIASLDGLRGISIWIVMLSHAWNHYAKPASYTHQVQMAFSALAYFGVTVFFVISGFLITFLLLKERSRSPKVSLPRFYRRRATRILPAFLLYAIVILFFGKVTVLQAIYAFTFTTSYFFNSAYRLLQQLWTLSVEEQFYILWPLLWFGAIRNAKRCCWIVMVLCPMLRIVLKHTGYIHAYAHAAPAVFDAIAAGCLLAFYQEEMRTIVRRYFLSTSAFVGLCLGTVGIAEIIYRKDVVVLWGFVACLIAVVISAAIEREDKFLNRGLLVWSGLLSYSLYLWQQPFLTTDGPLNYLSVRLCLTFVVAYLSYRFVEQPILRVFNQKPLKASVAIDPGTVVVQKI
jgi:peptidoglycan/LPS O-acetylase OafA/YrhL